MNGTVLINFLDHRSQRIKTELDDARRLKEEAAKLLAEYKARHATAEREALRPPVGKPSMTASNGSMNAMTAPAN